MRFRGDLRAARSGQDLGIKRFETIERLLQIGFIAGAVSDEGRFFRIVASDLLHAMIDRHVLAQAAQPKVLRAQRREILRRDQAGGTARIAGDDRATATDCFESRAGAGEDNIVLDQLPLRMRNGVPDIEAQRTVLETYSFPVNPPLPPSP